MKFYERKFNMNPAEMCEIEIIATGTELLLGRAVDSNSTWIAKQVTEHGGSVVRMTCVGDSIEEIEKITREGVSSKRDFIIITGGLGPSRDDLTIQSIAKALKRDLALNENTMEKLRRRFGKVHRGLEKMALLVEGSEPLGNPVGYAPGMKIKVGETTILALPGVPKEMKAVFKKGVISLIDKVTNKRKMAKCIEINMRWSDFTVLQQKIKREFPGIYLKTHSRPPTQTERSHTLNRETDNILLDILVEGSTIDSCKKTIREVTEIIEKLVKERDGTIRRIKSL
jgi:molybdenum cofactor synthesis domain-containing protein